MQEILSMWGHFTSTFGRNKGKNKGSPVAHPSLGTHKHHSASLKAHRTEWGKNVPFVWADFQSDLLIFAVVCSSTLRDCWPLESEILRRLLSLFFHQPSARRATVLKTLSWEMKRNEANAQIFENGFLMSCLVSWNGNIYLKLSSSIYSWLSVDKHYISQHPRL